MRISTGQIFLNASNSMMENQTSLLDIQDKMSSGKQFTRLADDPVGASQVVSLKRELAQLDMFNSNIDASRRRLELEETTMDDLNTAQDRMRELVVYAANGTLSDADRVTIASELEELVEYAAGLMNTRDAKGEYLFSGSQGNIQTYEKTGSRYTYQGDASNRDIQVSSALYVQSTDNGRYLFESVLDEPSLKATGTLRGSFDAENLNVTDPEAFAAFMRQTGDITVEVDQYDDGTLPPDNITYTYTLLDSAGNVVEDASGKLLQNIDYDAVDAQPQITLPGASLVLDLPVPVTGTPGASSEDLSDTELPTLNVSDANAYMGLMRQAGGSISIQSVEEPPLSGSYVYKAYGADGSELTDGAAPTPNPLLTVTPPIAPALEPTLTLNDAQGTPALELQRDGVAADTTADVTLEFESPADLKLQFDQPPTNILNAVMETVELMREPVAGNAQARADLNERFALTLDQLNQSQERLSEATSTLGARINKLDKAELSNTDFKLMTEGTLSAVQDLDYAAASTELAKRKLSLEATYASFTQIKDLSLFNYIR